MVKKARDEIERRVGGRGVPVIVASPTLSLGDDGHQGLKDLMVGLTTAQKPLCFLSKMKTECKEFLGQVCNVVEKDNKGLIELSEWLERCARGEEQGDLVTDVELARGWELDTAIVVAVKGNTCWVNAVMRAVSHVVLVSIGTAVWREHQT